MSQPHVSVVVPAYNVESHLDRCLGSLIDQSEAAIEIIVVDDGSTDSTRSIIDRFGELDSRVVGIYQQNRGVSAARNAGIRRASGRYVCFLDGDDWADSGMIETMLAMCEDEGAQVAIAGATIDTFDVRESLVSSVRRVPPRAIIDPSLDEVAPLVSPALISLLGYPWNKLYLHSWLISLGEFFDEEMSLFEDLDYNARVLKASPRVVVIDDAFVHYVQRPVRSLGTAVGDDFLLLHREAILNVDAILRGWRVDESLRDERRADASALALWSAIRAAGRTDFPRDSLVRMLEAPGVDDLLTVALESRNTGWRGKWATTTLKRGWYRCALLPTLPSRMRQRARRSSST